MPSDLLLGGSVVIPQAFIQDLETRVDIVDVVGKHVKLRKAGANLFGLCPFHGEKTASFSVSPVKQIYHCFGCKAGGGAINFLMEYSGLSFVEAIEELAQSVGLAVPQEVAGQGQRNRAPSPAPNLIELLGKAAGYYQTRLKASDRPIAYLKARGLSGRTAARFALGYAPDGWRNLDSAVPDYDDKMMVTAGLVSAPDEPDEPAAGESAAEPPTPVKKRRKRYDRFRDRIMFPIRNMRGGVIGFGARVLDKGEPKYLNSPETPVFSKGRELYGIHESRTAMRNADQAIVVEGYMDVVMLSEHGIDNAVATLGTATTDEHIRKLLRLVDQLVFCFDGDAAGKKAAWRALQACLAVVSDTQRINFLFLPDGADPDSYVQDHGAPAFREAVTQSLPLSGFLMRELESRADLDAPEGRAHFLAQARPLLHQLRADGLRMQISHQIAERCGIGMIEFERYMAAEKPKPPQAEPNRASASAGRQPENRPSGGADDFRPVQRNRRRSAPTRSVAPSLSRRLSLLAVCHPVLCRELSAPDVSTDYLPQPMREWFERVGRLASDGSLGGNVDLLSRADVAGMNQIRADLASDWAGVPQLTEEEARAEFEGALQQLHRKAVIQAASELANSGLEDEEQRKLYRELLASQRRS